MWHFYGQWVGSPGVLKVFAKLCEKKVKMAAALFRMWRPDWIFSPRILYGFMCIVHFTAITHHIYVLPAL